MKTFAKYSRALQFCDLHFQIKLIFITDTSYWVPLGILGASFGWQWIVAICIEQTLMLWPKCLQLYVRQADFTPKHHWRGDFFAFTLFVHGYSFQINYLGNSFWLGGEICSSDINMHEDYSWEILRTVHLY